MSPRTVVGIEAKDNYKLIKLEGGEQINTKAVIITTAVQYRHPEARMYMILLELGFIMALLL